MGKVKSFLKGFLNGFKSFGYVVSSITNFVLLFIVYFTTLGLTSLIAKLFGKHFLDLNSERKSYWIKRKKIKKSLEELKRMF
jgi:hypothetical protein